MCGIIGVIKKNMDSAHLYECFQSIKHRGPDDSGVYEDTFVFLGNHRLKIQDLSQNGHQPMFDVTGRYSIVYNGEIYNHMDVRKELISYGFKFNSNSDTETILYGYIHFGKNILNKLNGIFAFAIYDKLEAKLFAARDQMGVKPFYYYFKGDNFSFASELKSLIHIPGFDKTLNYKALVNYLNFLWSPGEITPFKYVSKLLPGECLTIDVKNVSGSFKKEIYYTIPFSNSREFYNDKIWIDTIDRKLTQAVDRQLLSDIPVGFFLSGGIDSSVIVAEVRKKYPDLNINCFTIKQNDDLEPEGFRDDYNYAKQVAAHLNVNLHTVDGGIDIVKNFDKMIWHLDEPQSDIAPLYVYKVCEEARKSGINVLIGGVGGDDLFSGYRRHQALFYDKYLQYTPKFILPAMANMLKKTNSNNPTIRRINKLLKRTDSGKMSRLVGYYEWFPILEHLNLFTGDMQQQILNFNPDEYLYDLLKQIPVDESSLNKMLYLELKTFLVDHNLNYTDKMGMACGVEVRVPFLDLDLVKMSTKMPMHLKMKGTKTKYGLRKVAERYLPHTIVNRSKTGFGAPVRKWITDDLDHMVHDRLNSSILHDEGIFDAKAVMQLVKENRQGKIDGSYTILTILAIESWLQQFTKERKHSEIITA